jgi:hypothetical protein
MCSVDAPAPQVIEADKPVTVRNPYLDETDRAVASADALRRGRSSLVIPTNTGIGFEGRGAGGAGTSGGTPFGNAAGPIGNRGGSAGGSSGGNAGPFIRGGDVTRPRNRPRVGGNR